MQMAKISSALYDIQSNKKLFYVSISELSKKGSVSEINIKVIRLYCNTVTVI